MQLPDIRNAKVRQKRVFLLSDLDVPLSAEGTIEDATRLEAGLSTIQYLLKREAELVVVGKLGRPKGRVEPALSLLPVVKWYKEKIKSHKLEVKNQRIGGFDGWKLTDYFYVLENIRFHKEEEENDQLFAKELANLAEVYVNNAFSLTHRNHASVVGVPQYLPHYAGLHLLEEVGKLSYVVGNPKRPLVVIIGGKKIETKLPLVKKMLGIADYVLVGGKIAQEKDILVSAQILNAKAKLIVADTNQDGSDITQKSLEQFISLLSQAAMIVWNGSMGIIEMSNVQSDKGTRILAQAIAKSRAYKIVGGGDTVEYLQRIGLEDKFDFVSTGGGAMLAFLSGEKLPGLEALCQ